MPGYLSKNNFLILIFYRFSASITICTRINALPVSYITSSRIYNTFKFLSGSTRTKTMLVITNTTPKDAIILCIIQYLLSLCY